MNDEHEALRRRVESDGFAVVRTEHPLFHTVGLTRQGFPELVTVPIENIDDWMLSQFLHGVAASVLRGQAKAVDGTEFQMDGDGGHVHFERIEHADRLTTAKLFAPFGWSALYVRPCWPGSTA